MKIVAILALLSASIVLAQAPDAVLKRAIAAHQSGDLDAAIQGYRTYLKSDPKNVDVRSNLGAALASQGKYADAVREYQSGLKAAPSHPGVMLNLALAYYKMGDIAEAARELAALRTVAPSNTQATILLADCWLQMGENAKVIELLTPMRKQQPGDLGLAYMLGTALVRDKREGEGQRVLEPIFRKGESAETRLLLGAAKLNASDFAGALEDLSKAVAMNPKLPTVHAYHGRALMATGDSAGAADAFRKELALNPNDFDSNLNLAVILKQDQAWAEASKYLERALRVRPRDLRVRYQQATISLAQGHLNEALRELESVTKEAPQFTEAHVSLATIYYRLKRKDDGDRERAIVLKLNADAQARQPKSAAEAERNSP